MLNLGKYVISIKYKLFTFFIIAEADREAVSSGRATSENLPSKLMENIPKLMKQITDLLSHGVTGLFRDAKENDEENELSGKEANEEYDDENDIEGLFI